MNRADLDEEAPPAPDAEPQGFAVKRPTPKRKAQSDA